MQHSDCPQAPGISRTFGPCQQQIAEDASPSASRRFPTPGKLVSALLNRHFPCRRLLCQVGWLFLFASAALMAQTSASITGVVQDSSGAVIPKASITLTNTDTGATHSDTANQDGRYNFLDLVPGTYSVKASAPGFGASVHSNIVLQVQQAGEENFILQPGNVSSTVEVNSTALQLDTQDATVGQVIENQRITTLPLNGRDFMQLISLSANVTSGFGAPGQATLREGGSRASEQYAIMGLRSTSNYYTLDGIDNTDVDFNLIIMQPSIDAVQEFKVQTGVYPAEFGREAAQINVLTNSGTNQFHGTAYEFLRNDVVDAQQYNFNGGAAPAKNPFRWNQYGYTLGGPVLVPKVFNGRNRLFFMTNFEGYNIRQSTNALFTVPTKPMRGGDFSSLLPGNQLYNPATKTVVNGVPTGQAYQGNIITNINPVSQLLLAYLPTPTINTTELKNNYEAAENNPTNKYQFTGRIDWTQSQSSNWFFRYSWTNENALTSGIFENGDQILTNGDQGVLGYTHVFSSNKVNDFHFGLNIFQNNVETQLAGQVNVVASLGIPGYSTPSPASWGIPAVGGFTDGFSGFGATTSAPFLLDDETFQLVDNFSWTLGKHALRFGVDLRRDHYDYTGNEFSRGQFLFEGTMTQAPGATSGGDAFADFLTGYCYTCTDALSAAQTDLRATSQAYYIEDTFNATPRLTINAGLRYEFIPPWDDQAQNIVNTITPPLTPGGGTDQIPDTADVTDPTLQPVMERPGTGSFYAGHTNVNFENINVARSNSYGGRLIQSNFLNLAPRLGISYNPASTWVVRAGAGIFYNQDSGIEYFDMARGWGRINPQGNPEQPNVDYQNFIIATNGVTQEVDPDVYGITPNLKTPNVYQYILNVQHNLTRSTMLELDYSGSRALHLWGLINTNAAIPGNPNTLTSTREPFPQFDIIQVMMSQNYSDYNAGSVKLSRSLANGLTYSANFTWSKSLDTSSGIRGTNTDILPQNSRCIPCEYGYSAFNIPHLFVGSVIYNLPFGKGQTLMSNAGGLLNEIAGGWQVSSIVTWRNGFQLNTEADSATAGTLGYGETRLDTTGVSPNSNSGGFTRTHARWWNPAAFAEPGPGTFGDYMRNALEGPSYFDWDAAVHKNFPIHEAQQLDFRLEMFNAPNHPNLGNPGTDWGSTSSTPGPTFGDITSTYNAPNSMREIQGALKFVF
jgi:hypothetical protein